MDRTAAHWHIGGQSLYAVEPTLEAVERAAELLAAGYNEPYNRRMMSNSCSMSPADVIEHYQALMARRTLEVDGARVFLLYRNGRLVGDADLRHIGARRAEFAILIAAREEQGQGLGTGFAVMLHALAFRELGLDRIHVTIVPQNVASRLVFGKLGYTSDMGEEARAFADDPSDLTLSIGRSEFERAHELHGLSTGPVSGGR